MTGLAANQYSQTNFEKRMRQTSREPSTLVRCELDVDILGRGGHHEYEYPEHGLGGRSILPIFPARFLTILQSNGRGF